MYDTWHVQCVADLILVVGDHFKVLVTFIPCVEFYTYRRRNDLVLGVMSMGIRMYREIIGIVSERSFLLWVTPLGAAQQTYSQVTVAAAHAAACM